MDYQYEQSSEVEALDSIYYGDMQIIEKAPFHKFSIPIKSEGFDDGDGLACQLVFTYTSKYPDEVPVIEIENEENFDDLVSKEDLHAHLVDQANENLGMVMVFTLVSAGQEWLNERWDDIKREKEEKILAKLKADEEAEQKRFEGTRVTVESFLVWRKQFEIDMGIQAKRERESKEKSKLTGKELFLRDTTLNESDLKFLDDGDAVKVDESLFQDLDDTGKSRKLQESLAAWNRVINGIRANQKLEELEMTFKDGTKKKIWKVNRSKPEGFETVDFT